MVVEPAGDVVANSGHNHLLINLDSIATGESIPFTETRGYVRRALFYAAIYQRRLGRPIMKLQSVMLPIPPRDARGPDVCAP